MGWVNDWLDELDRYDDPAAADEAWWLRYVTSSTFEQDVIEPEKENP